MKRRHHSKHFPLAALLTITLVLAAALGCTSRNLKQDRKDLIPSQKLANVITDMYLTDGLMTVPGIRQMHESKDSVIVYMEVLAQHGYTRDQFDKTMKFYFLNNPKKLQRIYNEVISRLTEIQSEVQTRVEKVPALENLWPGRAAYSFPEDGITDPVFFEYQLADTGLYTLKLNAVVFSDDQSENPRITVWFWKADTSAMGVSSFWQEVPLPKDGAAHEYTLSASVPDSSFTAIRGWLLNHDPKNGRWEKHSRINNISLTRHDYSIVF